MGTMGHTAGLRRAFLFYLLLRLTLTNSLLGKSRSRTVISASGPTGIWIQQSLRSLCLSAHSSTGDAFASQLQNKSALNLPLQRQRQVRRKHVNRRPKYYWFNATNLRNELFNFWTQRGVQLKKSQIPPIPSEVILLYYERHDLRAAIAKNGGRLSVSNMLRGAPIVPGRWQDAVEESPETRALIEADPILSLERPPSMPGMTVSNLAGVKDSGNFTQVRWLHQSGRKPKGFWNLQTTVEELYDYVDLYRERNNRPSVWMPRPSELSKEGRDDLKQALYRYGGASKICRMAGMVPYREWYYFEGQLELLLELQCYLDNHADGNYSHFPTVQDIKCDGYDHLHALIQYYGGRKFLAAKLGMLSKNPGLNWGTFDLDFAIKLLLFIREHHLGKNPPLRNPTLAIPSQQILFRSDEGAWLDSKINEFGGYENVARRLGLAFPFK